MKTPYYHDEWVTLYHGDNRGILPHLPMVDSVLTDPPFGKSTHNGAVTLAKKGTTGETGWERSNAPQGVRRRDVARKLVDFDAIPYADLQVLFASVAPKVRRWFISFMERRYVEPLEQWCEQPDSPLLFVREGVYYKPNGAPQVSGDRPAQGWENVAMMHRKNSGRLRWNGGGHDCMYIYNKPHAAKHPTQKAEAVIRKLIEQFTNPGETVLDMFAGSGVVGVVCKQLRRHCILIEENEKHCKTAANWLRGTQPMMEALIQAAPQTMELSL